MYPARQIGCGFSASGRPLGRVVGAGEPVTAEELVAFIAYWQAWKVRFSPYPVAAKAGGAAAQNCAVP